jgi:hypothetical protein
MQGSPEQQSAFELHVLPEEMHPVGLHVNCPEPFGTHGLPLQQSLAVAHVCPDERHPTPASPGTPA